MKRGGYLPRRTPLRSTSPLERRTPLRVVGKKVRRDRHEMKATRPIVEARSGGICEAPFFPHVCTSVATEMHHRKRRSQGGDNSPENIAHLCSNAHARVHAFPAEAYAVGLLIPNLIGVAS